MKKTDKIYVAGHRGLVGSALMRQLKAQGYKNLVTHTHAELDLTDQHEVRDFFAAEKPKFVFLAAAKVGGILANNLYPAEFIHQNLVIQSNVIHESWRSGVQRLLFLGSSCIFPRECSQPIKEDYLLSGPLEPTNRPYAVAKIAGIEMCWSYNRQYGTNYLAVMPTNLYGPNDNYDLDNSHVIPALIRKMYEAKENDEKEVIVWGSGNPRREFLYSDDLADACVYLMNLPNGHFSEILSDNVKPPLVNIGYGQDQTIRELAERVAEVVGFKGKLVFDESKPDGIPQKLLDLSRMGDLGWQAKTKLEEGLSLSYENFKKGI